MNLAGQTTHHVSDVIEHINKKNIAGYNKVLLYINDHKNNTKNNNEFSRDDVDWMSDIDFANIFSEYIRTTNIHLLTKRILDLMYLNNTPFLKYCLRNVLLKIINIYSIINPDPTHHIRMFTGSVCVRMMDLRIEGSDLSVPKSFVRKISETMRFYQQVQNELIDIMFLSQKDPMFSSNIDKLLIFAIEHDYKYHKKLDRGVMIHDEISSMFKKINVNVFSHIMCQFDRVEKCIILDSAVAINIILERGMIYIKEFFTDVSKNSQILAKILFSLYSMCLHFYRKIIILDKNKQISPVQGYSVIFVFDFFKEYVKMLSDLCVEERHNVIKFMISQLSFVPLDTLLIYHNMVRTLIQTLDSFDHNVTLFFDIIGMYALDLTDKYTNNIKQFMLSYYDSKRTYNLIPRYTLIKCYTNIANSIITNLDKNMILNLFVELYWFEFDTQTKLLFYNKKIKEYSLWLLNLKNHEISNLIFVDIFDIVSIEEFKNVQIDIKSDPPKLNIVTQYIKDIFINTSSPPVLKGHIKNTISQNFKRFATLAPFDNDGMMSYRCCKVLYDIFPDILKNLSLDMYHMVSNKYHHTKSNAYGWLYSLDHIKEKIISNTLVLNNNQSLSIIKPAKDDSHGSVIDDEQRCFVCMEKATHKFKNGCFHGVCALCFTQWYITEQNSRECCVCKERIIPKF